MKKGHRLALFLMMLTLVGCSPTIYGVPQTTWNMMSETERLEAMQIYKERQLAYQKAREEHARLRAIELKAQQARQEEDFRKRQRRIDAIYRGEGAWGDLLRVTLRAGEMRIAGKHRGYEPVSFKIAAGETKQVTVYSIAGRQANLQVAYSGGALMIDDVGKGHHKRAKRFSYDQSWETGRSYPGVTSEGPLKLRGINAHIEILGQKGRSRNARDEAQTRPQVIVIQQQTPQPPPVHIQSSRPKSQPPQIVIIKDERQTPEPQGAVIKEQVRPPAADRQGAAMDHRKAPSHQHGQDTPGSVPADEKPQRSHKPPLKPPKELTAAPSRIKVTITKGQVKIKGQYHPFQPVTFYLDADQTRDIELKTPMRSASLTVSYRDATLYLDEKHPVKRAKAAETELKFDPNWHRGKAYRIGGQGKTTIKDVDVIIASVK